MMNSNIALSRELGVVFWTILLSCCFCPSLVNGFSLARQKQLKISNQRRNKELGLHTRGFSSSPSSSSPLTLSLSSSPNEEELRTQKSESIQSLSEYHDGTWVCKNGATSFSISSDTAAGIINKSTSMQYQTSVSVRFSSAGLKMVETFSWKQSSSYDEEELTTAVTRSVPLVGPSIDVDSVDASYSVDQTLMDLPSVISGTESIVKFGIEHVLAVQDNTRVRAFCLYGMDDRLMRIIIADEERLIKEDQEQQSLLLNDEDEEMSNSIEQLFSKREPTPSKKEQQMKRLKTLLSGSETNDTNAGLKRHPITMFGLSLGPWLGDSVIRDRSLLNAKKKNESLKNSKNRKGFGGSKQNSASQKKQSDQESEESSSSLNVNQSLDGFAEWALGVQKVAMLYKWDFDETVRHVRELGRSMGPSYCSTLPKSSMGIINERMMSRRIPQEDRMLYIDYDMGAYAGFTLGSVYLKLPTFLFFSQMDADKLVLPFVTEFAVFQKDGTDNDSNSSSLTAIDIDDDVNNEIICSKMMRVYNNNGQLKQGITSFFTLKPLSNEADRMDP